MYVRTLPSAFTTHVREQHAFLDSFQEFEHLNLPFVIPHFKTYCMLDFSFHFRFRLFHLLLSILLSTLNLLVLKISPMFDIVIVCFQNRDSYKLLQLANIQLEA